ncbi:hypothetical protein [Luteibacter yeojuensis]|uniref:Secreted protein n=1 Tax=Luteibacter yeojuensis TaxID=345309 RepID=A0A0F3KIS5_9GAMM|nr:hypothetical protein [Luteibacter yeojuensis]KJV30024.1 hypothetical protein VI08_15275 [Luteibacter yeojuensis]
MPDSKRPFRVSAVAAALAIFAAATATPALADPPDSKLASPDAYGAAGSVAYGIPGIGELKGDAPVYDLATRRWTVDMVNPEGQHVVTTIDETTGDICARYPGRDACVASGSAADQLASAERLRLAQEAARRNPPPDVEGLWVAALESMEAHSDIRGPQTWYVSVHDKEGRAVDLPIAVMARAHMARIQLMRMTQAPKNLPPPSAMMTYLIYGIGDAYRREDGMYALSFTAYCGGACAIYTSLVMSHDKTGWHYVSYIPSAVE